MSEHAIPSDPVSPDRRAFLKDTAAASAGFVLGFYLPSGLAAKTGGQVQSPVEVNAWIRITRSGRITLEVARAEMGQGSSTSLPMLIAEELECDWQDVAIDFVSPAEHLARNRVYVSMSTGGSRSVRDSQSFLRQAGATAREMLKQAAARRWGVPVTACTARLSRVMHTPSKRTLSYGELAEAASTLPVPQDVPLKDPSQWRLIGKPVRRLDIPEKVDGRAVFGVDVQVPGLLHAAIVQCPVFGGRPAQVDSAAALRRRGVKKVVAKDDFVAVVADNWWRAHQAAKALDIDWDFGGNEQVNDASIRRFLEEGLGQDQKPVKQQGDIAAAFKTAAKVVQAEYFTPFLNHATLEPQNCTARVAGDRVEIWVGSQNAEASLLAAAETAGVPEANVVVHRPYLGGAFGRRGATQDFVRQAVTIAMELPDTPIKLAWSREEDMQHDFFRPVSLARQRAALDDKGRLIAWEARLASPSIIAKLRPGSIRDGVDPQAANCFHDQPYQVPNLDMRHAIRDTHVPVGYWRSVYHSQNPFARECFLDEVAAAAGQDPFAFRMAMLKDQPKQRGVLEAAAKAADWQKPAQRGVHRGLALTDGYGSYAAAVIELSLSPNKAIRLHRVIVAVDPGYVANPDSAEAQIQSCVAYGLSAVFTGEINIRGGRVVQTNFTDYPVMLLRDMPMIVPVLVPSGGFWGGMGEPPLMPLAPALVNALAQATGERVRSLPLSRHGYTLGEA